jgi:predicted PurR-regulated permease PerM
VILAVIGIVVFGNVDNVVRPWVMSGSARMSTLVLIVSLLGGVSAFGFIGIVLGPVVAALLTALVESYHLGPEDDEADAPPPAPPPEEPVQEVVPAPAPASSAPGSVAPGSGPP